MQRGRWITERTTKPCSLLLGEDVWVVLGFASMCSIFGNLSSDRSVVGKRVKHDKEFVVPGIIDQAKTRSVFRDRKSKTELHFPGKPLVKTNPHSLATENLVLS